MSQALDLKQLERLAFRRTYQDGLYDIYIGGNIRQLCPVCFYGLSRQRESNFLIPLLYLVLGLGLSGLVFWMGKKYITLPRIGLVKFGLCAARFAKEISSWRWL